MKSNPFFELYIGDKLSASDFLTIFSPVLVPHSEAIFKPGNIVVKGVQGCGKSMLLRLLKPDVRLQYLNSNEDFPVPDDMRKFICGSVNLIHCNVIDFGYRSHIDDDKQKIEFMFADFLNYLCVESLLRCISRYLSEGEAICKEIGLSNEGGVISEIAQVVSNLTIWEGWIDPTDNIDDLSRQIESRIQGYRRYLHGKERDFPDDLFETSTPIGRPQLELSSALKKAGIIESDTNVFIDIDQYEELGNISSRDTDGAGVDYRAVVNKALSYRDPDVSYRIGTRGHSWGRNRTIHGTSGKLENMRHYRYVDLDELLMKDEFDAGSPKNLFAKFAEDVFRRRLGFAQYTVPGARRFSALEAVYGSALTPEKKINDYLGIKEPARQLRFDDDWSKRTTNRLETLARKDLFNAKLGEVWIRQKGDGVNLDVSDDNLPWNANHKRWWRKERAQILSMQIASAAGQRLPWGGAREIVELAGGSILAFINLNQFIWAAWMVRNLDLEPTTGLPTISPSIQSVAILKASHSWLEMINEQTGSSSERIQFIKVVANTLRRKLMEDRALSYPGANGFSLLEEEILSLPLLKRFIEDLSDYGNIIYVSHTTKEKNRKPRKKIYFHPMFAPALGLPYIRTKEPYYAKLSEVFEWMVASRIDMGISKVDEKQPTLI